MPNGDFQDAGEIYDVVVAGASAAGAVCAYKLAERGLRVAVVDKDSFPRKKPCGEGLSAYGITQLVSCGLGDVLKAIPTKPFYGYGFWRRGRFTPLSFGRGSPAGVTIERYYLDRALNGLLSSSPSVSPWYGVKICAASQTDDTVTVHVKDNTKEKIFRARFLVIADGARSITSGFLGVPERKRSSDRYSLTYWCRGSFADEEALVHIILRPGYQICCTPLARNRLNVSILCKKEHLAEVRAPGFLKRLVVHLARTTGFQLAPEHESEEASGREKGASSPLGSGPIGATVRRASFGRALLIGDACEQLDPLGGMGISHAVLSATLAAEAIGGAVRDEGRTREKLSWYEHAREKETRPLRGFTRLSYLSLVGLPAGFFAARLPGSPAARAIGRAAHGHGTAYSPASLALNVAGMGWA